MVGTKPTRRPERRHSIAKRCIAPGERTIFIGAEHAEKIPSPPLTSREPDCPRGGARLRRAFPEFLAAIRRRAQAPSSGNPLASLAPDRTLAASMSSQLQQYLPILMFLGVAVGFAFGTLIFSVVAGKLGRRTKVKDSPYECGMLPEGEGSARLSVKFYLVALLFVLFDIEVVFMYPWAVTYKDMLKTNAPLVLGGMLSFLGILFVGYVYALKKKAFDWRS